MLEKRIVIIIKIFVYATFLMPLIVMGDTFIFPFVFPKAIYFRILVEIMFGLYLILCLVNKEYRPKQTPLLIVLCSLFFVLFLSSLFGVDFQRSMWGNHERMSGWFTLIHFGAFFFVVSQIFRAWPEWRWLLRWSLALSLAVGVTGLNFLLPDNSIMKIGGGGSLGNQIYLANFVLFHVFIAWLLFRKEEKRGWKIFAAGVGVIEILIMFYNGKRGPFLGLLAGLFVGILLYSLFTKIKKWRWAGLGFIGLLVILGGVAMAYRQSPLVQKIPMLGALANISFQSGTGATRAIAWEIAYKAWKEKPVFGWGVENFYYAFNKYYNPKSLEYSYYETWFDRSHNIFLDYLSTSGILGFLTYLGLFGTVFYLLGHSFRVKRIDLNHLVFLAMFFIAYGSQNFFVFDHLSSYLIFFLMLAFTDVILSPRGEESRSFAEFIPTVASGIRMTDKRRGEFSWGWAVLITTFLIFLIYKTNIQPALANNRSLEAQKLMGQNFARGLEKTREALNTKTPHEVDLRLDLSRVLISFSAYPEALKSELYQQAMTLMSEELEKVIEHHPLEINAYLVLSQFWAARGNLAKAEEVLEKAQELSPLRQQVAYMRTRIKFSRRDFEGAIKILNKTIEDNSNVADSYWYLSLIYGEVGEGEKSLENLKIALEKGKAFTQPAEMIWAGDLFKKFKDYENARKLYEQILQKNQNDPKILLSLSEIWSHLGDNLKAREYAERAALYDPQTLEKARGWLK